MAIPTEPIGSIPRPLSLIGAARAFHAGALSEQELLSHYDAAIQDTIEQFETTGSPVITDGEQAKDNFATYPIRGLSNLSADGVSIAFADGHIRHLPRLTAGPFPGGYPSGKGPEVRARSGKASRYFRLGIESAVSARRHCGLFPRTVSRRVAGRTGG
jgi:hypothetical protein